MDNVVLGTMNILYSQSQLKSNDEYLTILNLYCEKVGKKNAILDTAYYYGNTQTERILGELIPSLPFIPKIATKVNPWFENNFSSGLLGQLSPIPMLNQFNTSLLHLHLEKVDLLYLHCPDHETNQYETLETCEYLWRKEKIDSWGLSNYSLNQTKEIFSLCEKYGIQFPKYYQGMYSVLTRKVEEIFPFLNENKIEFWSYNPLAGGLLTGKYNNKGKDEIENGRFYKNSIYQNIFWKENIIKNINMYYPYHGAEGIRNAYLWINKYSKLINQSNKIIMGVSSYSQLIQNIEEIDNGILIDLDPSIIKSMETLYKNIKEDSPNYYY